MKVTSYYSQAMDDILLLDEAGMRILREKIRRGELTPVFFGSALTNFGVQTFLETYLQFAPTPRPKLLKMSSLLILWSIMSFRFYFQDSGQYESSTP